MFDFLKNLFGLDRNFGARRSGSWRTVRNKYIKEHPRSEVSGRKGKVVHHILPVWLFKYLELEESNLITLTNDEHFLLAHLCYWRSYNKNLKEDAKVFNIKIFQRP